MKPLGSETFDLKNIRTDEYILFVKAATENGTSLEQADLDARCIDDLISMKKTVDVFAPSQRYTPTGRLRKNNSFSDFVNNRFNLLLKQSKQL